ncbi:TetR/AcrR family transcriptional regulator [Streptococcus pantholopis]|uniref:TetR family transcriptional regulator n=1 Tax=Streptococcus pantholopis TaxID=1811193 RepID=A0A172Q9R7_9STRE|nr:TetR/AcrR family transcriptional regulator [Streptococcus pantholopis]AND80206.1 TetR family transcriptional regulator [Streptococcus pantholopis]
MSGNKKQDLKSAAYDIFSKKGYKAAGISEIAKQAGVATGSFYNYYDSKEAIFLDIYIEENNRVRQAMIDEIDWEEAPAEVIGQIFGRARSFVSSNKILTEWYNPAISGELHSYYASEKGKSDYPFHQFLVETFTNRMQAEGYPPEKIQEVLQVYQLFYYMDTHITEKDFPNVSQTIERLATYFVKGFFK